MKLKDAIRSGISVRPPRRAINTLVAEAHHIARAYLLQKVKRGTLQPDFFGLSVDDLALDCCGDLFQRDDSERFIHLVRFFEAISWQDLDEADLYIAFRRLIFSKVSEGLFRRYREADPGLAKLIRNLKLGVKADERLSLLRQDSGWWLVVGEGAGLKPLPLVPEEILEAYLITSMEGGCQVPEVLSAFVAFTALEPSFCNGYSLTAFAQIVRSAFIRLGEAGQDDQTEGVFIQGELEQAIRLATEQIKTEKYDSYVGRGKVDAATYETYFEALNDILTAHFTRDSMPQASYFEALASHMPGLVEDRYRSDHRNILEYLAKLTRARLYQHLSG